MGPKTKRQLAAIARLEAQKAVRTEDGKFIANLEDEIPVVDVMRRPGVMRRPISAATARSAFQH